MPSPSASNPNIRTYLSARTLRALTHYNQRTGEFTWRITRSRTARAGDDVGTVRKTDRQVIVRINGKQYAAQRLIWLYVTGERPKGRLVFLDRDPTNLKWSNIQPESEVFSQTKAAAAQRRRRARLAEIKARL
jgi:hypothetical protein